VVRLQARRKVPIVVLCNGRKIPLNDAGNGVVNFNKKRKHYYIEKCKIKDKTGIATRLSSWAKLFFGVNADLILCF